MHNVQGRAVLEGKFHEVTPLRFQRFSEIDENGQEHLVIGSSPVQIKHLGGQCNKILGMHGMCVLYPQEGALPMQEDRPKKN